MGLKDRDYYWDKHEELTRRPKGLRGLFIAKHPAYKKPKPSAPKLWGENWHWTIKVGAWCAGAGAAFAVMKLWTA